jgi:predicted nucleic acid-binding protein
VTAEPGDDLQAFVLDASALLRLYLADGPLLDLCWLEVSSVLSRQISQEHGISVSDACYLALALRHGAMLLTADGQLQAAARRVGCGG